jgi:hypothetical protein
MEKWLDRPDVLKPANALPKPTPFANNVVIFTHRIAQQSQPLIHTQTICIALKSNASPKFHPPTTLQFPLPLFAMSSFQDKAQGHINQLDKEVSTQFPSHFCDCIVQAFVFSRKVMRSLADTLSPAALQVSDLEQLGETDLNPKDLCCPRIGRFIFLLRIL